MARANRTPMHDAFSDEIERLAVIEDQNTLESVAHMLVRYCTAAQLDEARRELSRDGIDIPPAEGEADGD